MLCSGRGLVMFCCAFNIRSSASKILKEYSKYSYCVSGKMQVIWVTFKRFNQQGKGYVLKAIRRISERIEEFNR